MPAAVQSVQGRRSSLVRVIRQVPIRVRRGLDGFVPEQPPDHGQRHPGRDQPRGVRVAQVVHAGRCGQAVADLG